MTWALLGLAAILLLWGLSRPGQPSNGKPHDIASTTFAWFPFLAAMAGLTLMVKGARLPGATLLGVAIIFYLQHRWRQRLVQNNIREEPVSTSPFIMPIAEAVEILELDANYTRDSIQNAHRRLIRMVHPDRGGSAYLASRVNQARDVLLRHLDTTGLS